MNLKTMDLGADLTLHRTTPDDFDEVLAVVQDAARRVLEKGIARWRLYLTDVGVARVRRRVDGMDSAEVDLARREPDDAAVAVMSLEWSDREYWVARGADGLAGYVHMLSHRRAAHTGLGERMMNAAEGIIATRGRSLARLDCWAASAVLPGYYERLGYTRVEQVGGANGSLLMEKRVIE